MQITVEQVFFPSPETVRALRAIFKDSYPYLYHQTKPMHIQGIKAHGLTPAVLSPAADVDLATLRSALGDQPSLVCFRAPKTSGYWAVGNGQLTRTLRVESSIVLERRISVDWTFGNCWTWVQQRLEENPHAQPASLFLSAFQSFNSLACMDVIPTEVLELNTDPGRDLAAGLYRSLSETDLEA